MYVKNYLRSSWKSEALRRVCVQWRGLGVGVVVKSCRRQLYKLGQCFSSITHKKKRFLVTCRLHFWLINVYVYIQTSLCACHNFIFVFTNHKHGRNSQHNCTLVYGRSITFNFICLNLKKPYGCTDKVQGFINYVNEIVKKKKVVQT